MLVLLVALMFGTLSADPARDPLLVSVDEAAEMLGISRRFLIRLIDCGEVRTLKLGRRRMVPVAGLQEMIAERLTAS